MNVVSLGFELLFHRLIVHKTASLGSLDSKESGADEAKISVKERTQRFNKMASEVDLPSNQKSEAAKSVGAFPSRAKVKFEFFWDSCLISTRFSGFFVV